jgi:hypothetical protein
MNLIPIIWALSIILALIIGIAYRNILEAIKEVNKGLDKLKQSFVEVQKPVAKEEPKSVIIDPTDFEQQVKFEQEEVRRKLNDVP